jgi:tetratricopeptide (TPR) repeat protein
LREIDVTGLRPVSICLQAIAILSIVGLAGCGSPEQRAQNYYERGMALIAKGDDLNARLELQNAVKYKADKLEVWRALAGIDERTKAQALFLDLQRIVELDPTDLDSRLKLVRIMLAGGAAEAALKTLDVAKEGNTPNADLHALKAAILARTNDPAGALKEAQRAMEIDANNVDAVGYVAARKASEGDADGALKLLDALRPEPKDQTRIAVEEIQILLRKGDLQKAEPLLRKIIALDPKQAAYRNQLIQVLMAQRRFDEAEKEFRARTAADPADSKAGLDLVRFLNAVKGPEAARAELDARIKADGDVFDYQIALAQLEVAQGKAGDATEFLQTVAKSATTPARKAVAQLNIAEIFVGKGNRAAAESLISEILTADRRNAGALRLRASIKIDKGEIDGAIADLREALNDQPKSTDLLMLLAVAYERGGKPELAERQYADAFKNSDLDPGVALRYVAFLQRKGDLTHAEDVLVEVAGRHPGNVQILSSLAQIRLSRKNWTGALALADAIGRLGEQRGLADQIRAAALAGENKIDASIAAMENAHRAAPDQVGPVVALVSGYTKQGRADQAMALLQEMNQKFPGNAQLLVLTGQALVAQNKDEEALQSFKAAVAAQPKDPLGYNALYEFYDRKKNLDAAVDIVQAGLRELPGNPNFRLALAGLQIQKGNNDAAIAQYEGILKDLPKSPVAINNLVSLLLDNRSDKDSLNQALALSNELKNTNVPQFQDTFGWAQYKRGDYKAAASVLENVAIKLPTLAAVHYHLGMSYKATGETEKAKEQLKIALDLEPEGTPLKQSIRAAMVEVSSN